MRVATIPDGHPYLDAAMPGSASRLRDGSRPEWWRPSRWLDPAFVAANARKVDLVHVHFGFEHLAPTELDAWLGTLRDHDLPLVVTVHDLRNPHQEQREAYDVLLAQLVGAARLVTTLTPGAAAEIELAFGVEATVIPHPPLWTAATVRPPRPGETPPVVGIHLKSLRRNIVEPGRFVEVAAAATTAAGGRLRVDLHGDVASDDRVASVHTLAASGALDLRIHDRFDDRALADYLLGLDLSVLAHRFGTHSGWVELCRDLGTRALAPSCGYYAEQWPEVVTFEHDETVGLNEASLTEAIGQALARPAPPAETVYQRLARRLAVRDAHAGLYRQALLSESVQG